MGKSNKKGAVISGFDKIDYSQILDITRWDNKMRKLSFTEKLQVFMLSYFRAAGTLVISDKSRSKALRGLDIGTREVEAGMKIGSLFMALGTLTVDLSGELSMEPNILFKDTFSVTAKLQDIITGDEKARNFWVLVFTLTCLYVGRRTYNYNKKYNIVEKVQKWWRNQKKQKPAGI